MSFAEATGVVRVSPTRFEGLLHPGWDIFGVSNGGYVMTMAARAMAQEAPERDLASISGYFTNPGRPGPVGIEVNHIKVGRVFSTMRADVIANDEPLVTVLAAYADRHRPIGTDELVGSTLPDLPPPDQCIKAEPASEAPFPPPFVGKVRLHIHPDDAPDLENRETGAARVRGWFSLLDAEGPDPLSVVTACDAFPPAVFNSNLPLAWTPTLDLTVHIRDPRPHRWLACEFRTRFVTGGLLEEDGEMWSPEGDLVAQSRQLALVPR